MKPLQKFENFEKWYLKTVLKNKYESSVLIAWISYLQGRKDSRCKSASNCIDFKTEYKTREV